MTGRTAYFRAALSGFTHCILLSHLVSIDCVLPVFRHLKKTCFRTKGAGLLLKLAPPASENVFPCGKDLGFLMRPGAYDVCKHGSNSTKICANSSTE